MKRLQGITRAGFATMTAFAIVGCGHKDGDRHAHTAGEAEHAHEGEAGITFNAKKGLLVSPGTAKVIGLRVAEVEERKIASAFQFSAQVYRAASEVRFASLKPSGVPAALASGSVSPANAAKLIEGQTVTVQNAEGGVVLPGRIVTLERDLEQASGQVEVLLAIADAPQPIASGAFVSVTVALGGEKSVVSVPLAALLRTMEGDFVYTVSGEHFVRAPVKLGLINHEHAEITDGLYAGDQVVVQPARTLWLAELQSLRGGKSCADGH